MWQVLIVAAMLIFVAIGLMLARHTALVEVQVSEEDSVQARAW